MKRVYFLLFCLIAIVSVQAQPPCQLSLDSIFIDQSTSNCNHLYFKYKVSGGTVSSYYWTYGDGNSCGCIKPKNFYTKNGNYQVCGRIQDANGCKDSLCITVKVNCTNPCDLSEIGIYSFDTVSYNCNEYEFVSFVSPNAKRIVWEFGDGDSSNSKYSLHTFQKNGNYKVRLIVQDSISCGDTANLDITINCDQKAPCDFKINRIDTITKGNCKTKGYNLNCNKNPKEVKWNFGDGNSETSGKQTQHAYKDTGVYEVCAIATDTVGCSDTTCVTIKVKCPKSSGFDNFDIDRTRIYPSPFTIYLNVKLESDATISVYDQKHALVYESDLKNGIANLDLSKLSKGLYFLSIKTAKAIQFYKIVKE
jgi:PKD repeat protein